MIETQAPAAADGAGPLSAAPALNHRHFIEGLAKVACNDCAFGEGLAAGTGRLPGICCKQAVIGPSCPQRVVASSRKPQASADMLKPKPSLSSAAHSRPCVTRRLLILAAALVQLAIWLRPAHATDLADLLTQKKVQVEVLGSDIENVTVRVRRTGTEPVTVDIAAGTFFESNNANAQNMVGTSPESVTITNNGWTTLVINAACASAPRDIPTSTDRFAVKRLPDESEIAIAARAVSAAHASTAVSQAAIWIISDDADYDNLGELVEGASRVINQTEAAQAMKILDRAGINIRQKRIWNDRIAIANGTSDTALAAWLRGR